MRRSFTLIASLLLLAVSCKRGDFIEPEKDDPVKLETPANFKADPEGVTATSILLTWDGLESDELESYTVSYGLKGGSSFEELSSMATKLDITGLTSNKTYVLKLKAVSTEGEQYDSDWSDDVTCTTVEVIVPAVPDGLAVDNDELTSSTIKISWNAAENAVTYLVALKKETESEYTEEQVSATEYLLEGLEPDTKYLFKVKSRSQSGAEYDSEFTSELSATTLLRSAGIFNTGDMVAFAAAVALGETDGGEWKNREGAVVLNRDLDMTDIGWTPLELFTAVFDGNGKTISGLNIESGSPAVGMFATLGGTIRNLTLDETCSVHATTTDPLGCVGAFAGQMSAGAVIDGCINKGSVNGLVSVGGIVGKSVLPEDDGEAVIRNCENWGVVGTPEIESPTRNINIFVGGIIGRAGGIAAEANNDAGSLSERFEITDCRNLGRVSLSVLGFNSVTGTPHVMVGGIAGWAKNAHFTGCENTAQGSVGLNSSHFNNGHLGGIVGRDLYGTYDGCVNRGEVKLDAEIIPHDNNATEVKAGGIVGGAENRDEMKEMRGWFRNCENYSGISIVSKSSKKGASLGGIVGFVYNVYGTYVEGCKNFGDLKLTCTASGDNLGGIVGLMNPNATVESYIAGCRNEGNITSAMNGESDTPKFFTGGIAGSQGRDSGKVYIKDCVNTGDITSQNRSEVIAGGIIGETKGPVTGCSNSGTVLADGKHNRSSAALGGIAAQVYGSDATQISGCTNSGNIIYNGVGDGDSGANGVGFGGIVGRHNKGVIDGCTNTGTLLDIAIGPEKTLRGAKGSIAGWSAMGANTSILNCGVGGALGDFNSDAADMGLGAAAPLDGASYADHIYGKNVRTVTLEGNSFSAN